MSVHKQLEIRMDGRHVGTLAQTAGHRAAFAYSGEWLRTGFSISPFSLPLEDQVFVPAAMTFGGLWGVFADSLPDAWGRLLVNRMLKESGVSPDGVSQLDRLAIVGASGMGALTYLPAWRMGGDAALDDYDALAHKCRRLLNREAVDDLDAVFQMGGSSGGARPKAMTEEWIVKFPVAGDAPDVGVMEKAYMDCAAACGIAVPETKIVPSKRCDGYFAARRFDRVRQADGTLKRRHVLTAAALLEMDWRTPSLDYHTLMKLTKILCRDDPRDVRQMYRMACFNVFAHNRDDHAKNFSFLYDGESDHWHVSPAYDLTYSSTYYGEHTTTVDGNGADPGMKELTAVGVKAGLTRALSRAIAEECLEAVRRMLKPWAGE